MKWSLGSSKWFLPPRCLPAGMDAAQKGVRETNRAASVGEELGYLGEPCAAPCYGAVMRSVAWPWPGLQVRLTQTSWHKGWCERLGEEGQGGRQILSSTAAQRYLLLSICISSPPNSNFLSASSAISSLPSKFTWSIPLPSFTEPGRTFSIAP